MKNNSEILNNMNKKLNLSSKKLANKLQEFKDSGEEFELDEKEISINEKMPSLQQQYEQLCFQKAQVEGTFTIKFHFKPKPKSKSQIFIDNLKLTDNELAENLSELNSLKQEMENWKIQIVKSPEKIKKKQESARIQCEEVVSK